MLFVSVTIYSFIGPYYISIDILVEEHAIKLLEEMVGLWVTIRGYSIAGAWLEHHKHINKIYTVKALRKDLK